MKNIKIIILLSISILLSGKLIAQENQPIPKFYIGVAYGSSFSLGDFQDTNLENSKAGFAKDGNRYDLYSGYFLDKSEIITATGVFRYQIFETEIDKLIENFRVNNPGIGISGNSDEWRVYSLLLGIAYKLEVGTRFAILPRAAFGPIWATSPRVIVQLPNETIGKYFERTSEKGFGFGYEVGIGFKKDLGKHFALLPTFTMSGGGILIKNVEVITDSIRSSSDYKPNILSFNIGISLAYKFYN